MLILTRNITQSVMIGDQITVTVLGVKGNQVRLGIAAPKAMSVDRNEVRERKQHDPLSVCPGCGCFRDKCACDYREQRR